MEQVRGRMVVLRGQRVMLSGDLARLYRVEPKALVQAVKRNLERFPEDFMFALTLAEWRALMSQGGALESLKSQIVTSSWGGSRKPPLAFTEHGVAMLSSVLRSPRAIEVNIQIVRAFVHLRRWLIDNRELGRRVDALEKKHEGHFKVLFTAIEELMEPPHAPARKPIGFRSPAPRASPASPGTGGNSSRRSRR